MVAEPHRLERLEERARPMGRRPGTRLVVVADRAVKKRKRPLAVAGGPPDDGEVLSESGELAMPVGAIATDAMHKDQQGTGALLVHSNVGQASNILGRPDCRRGCGS